MSPSLPGNWLAACIADLTAPFLRVNWRELLLMAVFLRQFLPCIVSLYLKWVTLYSLITYQSKQRCPYACRQEYWNRDECFIAMSKHAALLKLRNSSSSFNIDWFTRNYSDQTDSKLPESGLCTHIILKTCDMVRNATVGEFVLRQKYDKQSSRLILEF